MSRIGVDETRVLVVIKEGFLESCPDQKMINLIFACTEELGIGMGGYIPWNIENYHHHFREMTFGGTLVVGRRTWLNSPKLLRNLRNRKLVMVSKGAVELEEVLKRKEDLWIIGGGDVFTQSIPVCDYIYLTMVKCSLGKIECDVHLTLPGFGEFERIDDSPWIKEGYYLIQHRVYRRFSAPRKSERVEERKVSFLEEEMDLGFKNRWASFMRI